MKRRTAIVLFILVCTLPIVSSATAPPPQAPTCTVEGHMHSVRYDDSLDVFKVGITVATTTYVSGPTEYTTCHSYFVDHPNLKQFGLPVSLAADLLADDEQPAIAGRIVADVGPLYVNKVVKIHEIETISDSGELHGRDIPLSQIVLFELSEIVNKVITALFPIGVLLSIWGLVQFVLHRDDKEARVHARKKMLWGLGVALISVILWTVVSLMSSTCCI